MDGTLWRLLLDWAPIAVFFVFLIYFVKRGGPFKRQAEHFDLARQYYGEHLEETRKIRASLERIATAMEKRGTQ